MFGIGMNEMVLIIIIAVVIIGPKQLPAFARSLGKMMTQFKRATNDLRNAVNEEVGQQIQMEEVRQIKASLEGDMHEIESTARNYLDEELKAEKELAAEVEGGFHSALYENPSSKPKSSSAKKSTAKKLATKKSTGKQSTAAGTVKTASGKPAKKTTVKSTSLKAKKSAKS